MDWNKRITPKDAQKMMDAYAKVYAPKEEPKPETEATAETEAPADEEETDKQKVFTREKMSKFGDLIAGVSGVPVVEAPAPVVEEAPAPVVEEAPRPEEEVADTVAAPDFEVQDDATKAQIKRAFFKSLKNKKMNKKILGEFIELVA